MGQVVAYPEEGSLEKTGLTYTDLEGRQFIAERWKKSGKLQIFRLWNLDEIINERAARKRRGDKFPIKWVSIKDPGAYACRCDEFARQLRAKGYEVC